MILTGSPGMRTMAKTVERQWRKAGEANSKPLLKRSGGEHASRAVEVTGDPLNGRRRESAAGRFYFK